MEFCQHQTQLNQLKQFRQELYQLLPRRADALLDLLDALCSNTHARSVVELSLNPLFRREYGSVHDAIEQFLSACTPEEAGKGRRHWEQQLARLIGRFLPPPQQRKFWLWGTDVVPVARPWAQTLEDRSFVYQPTPVKGQTPVTIGHHYSVVGWLPERGGPGEPRWVVPLQIRRVPSDQKAAAVGVAQLQELLGDKQQPFHGALAVHVADSGYSHVDFLGSLAGHPEVVNLVRVATNRVFYWPAPLPEELHRGHPRWYGERFDLKDPTTWGPPDETAETTWKTTRGRICRVHLQAWRGVLMRGTREHPMHQHPCTLIRVEVFDEQGQPVYRRPLWLLVCGERQAELSLIEAWEAYGQRFDLEHFFRFGKQRLLLAAYQTPVAEHEENWLTVGQLASVQLWLAREVAGSSWRPWERYLPARSSGVASPSQVQRNWAGIIRQIGTPARSPKPRGKSSGRANGASPGRRPRQAVVKKARKGRSTPAQ